MNSNIKSGMKYIIFLAILVIVPFIVRDRYTQHIVNMILIYSILAISINMVFGYLGSLTFGHMGLFAIGAYVSAILSVQFHLNFFLLLIISGIGGLVVGVLVGIPTLRLTGSYFAMGTLAFNKIIEVISLNWVDVTGGPHGVMGIQVPEILGFLLNTEKRYYYLLLVAVVLSYTVYRNIIRSHIGKTIIAVRDDETAAKSVGIRTSYVRVTVFTISSIMAAMAGSLYAHMVGYIAPESFPIGDNVTLLFMVVLGGSGRLNGPILGAIVVVLAKEYLQAFESYNMLIFGILVVVSVIVLPSGLSGIIERIKVKYMKKKGREYVEEIGLEKV
jgi:branched-chain amino acid transport system permease protein